MLVDATYRHQLTQVCEKAAELLHGRTAAEATGEWMRHFLNYVLAKNGMSEALNTVIASGADPHADSRALLSAAVAALLGAGAGDGTLRTDITPDDVLLLVVGIAQTAGRHSTEHARRLVDLVLDALTTGSTTG